MRRRTLAIVIAFAVFALSAAAAASLGGLSAADLGAEAQVVAACDDNGVAVEFTTAFANGEYEVTQVTLSGIAAACDGQDVEITLFDNSNNSLGAGADVYDDDTDSGSLTIDIAPDASAEETVGVAVIIAG